jgi:hypothetical protein
VNCERKFFQGTLSKGVDMKMRCKKARKRISLALDGRLKKARTENLQGHLSLCPSCRNWQQEQLFFKGLPSFQKVLEPGPGFYQKLKMKIDGSPAPNRSFYFDRSVFQPILLRAAMLLLMILSALFGFSLGTRLDVPGVGDSTMVFNQALNMEAFADAPAESFGAVYEHLLQGDRP